MKEHDYTVQYTLCASMDTPRCCMRADAIVNEGDITSVVFDTTYLTSYIYGFSSVDCDEFIGTYLRKHILSGVQCIYAEIYVMYLYIFIYIGSPFEILDKRGVGTLLELALHKLRNSNNSNNTTTTNGNGNTSTRVISNHPHDQLSTTNTKETTINRNPKKPLVIGVTGLHGADPGTISYYHSIKMNHVSVPPSKVTTAVISAAKATVKEAAGMHIYVYVCMLIFLYIYLIELAAEYLRKTAYIHPFHI